MKSLKLNKTLSEKFLIGLKMLSSALDNFEEILNLKNKNELLIFLDYDGTLSPIVEKPDMAVIDDERRRVIQQVSEKYITSIVSGRAKLDVKKRVNIDSCYYAGSHGFDISTPFKQDFTFADEFVPILKEIYNELCLELENFEGVILENNIFTLSVHYRLARNEDFTEIEKIVKSKLTEKTKLTQGKMVFEFRPNIEWNKGKAVLKLLEMMNKSSNIFCIYIGDDKTDEDAFKALKEEGIGIGIFVGSKTSNTEASFYLKDPNEVEKFLQKLIQ
jgi:trehalose 6-phosphate phosphatase